MSGAASIITAGGRLRRAALLATAALPTAAYTGVADAAPDGEWLSWLIF